MVVAVVAILSGQPEPWDAKGGITGVHIPVVLILEVAYQPMVHLVTPGSPRRLRDAPSALFSGLPSEGRYPGVIDRLITHDCSERELLTVLIPVANADAMTVSDTDTRVRTLYPQ
jgi:hypothetical protein